MLVWDDTLSVGVDHLDRQHQRWMALLNELHRAMHSGKGNIAVSDTLSEVVDYTQTHFRDEEKILRETHYLGYQAHKDMHELFIAELAVLQKSHAAGALAVPVFVANKLSAWFVNHIRVVDHQYVAHLARLQK